MKKEFYVKDISKMFNMTKRTIQYYDSIDLVKPAYIKENGYRVYTHKEIAKFIEIVIWKNSGLQSDEIKVIFEDSGKDTVLNQLDSVEQRLDREIEMLRLKKKNIDNIRKSFKKGSDEALGIHVRHLDKRLIQKVSAEIGDVNDIDELMVTGTQILKNAIYEGIPFSEFGFTYSGSQKQVDSTSVVFKCFYYDTPIVSETISILEEGAYLCSWFNGDLQDIPEMIERMLRFSAEHELMLDNEIIYVESFKSLSFEEPQMSCGELQIRILKG